MTFIIIIFFPYFITKKDLLGYLGNYVDILINSGTRKYIDNIKSKMDLLKSKESLIKKQVYELSRQYHLK